MKNINQITIIIDDFEQNTDFSQNIINFKQKHQNIALVAFIPQSEKDPFAIFCREQQLENHIKPIYIADCAAYSANRNQAIAQIATPYFIFAKTSILQKDSSSLAIAVTILDKQPEIAAVFAKTDDTNIYKAERFFYNDQAQQALITLPITQLASQAKNIDGHLLWSCDIGGEIKLFRRAIFASNIAFDPLLTAEYADFDLFYQIKTQQKWQLAYCPDFCISAPSLLEKSPHNLQTQEWAIFADKWHLTQQRNIGHGHYVLGPFPKKASFEKDVFYYAPEDEIIQNSFIKIANNGKIYACDFPAIHQQQKYLALNAKAKNPNQLERQFYKYIGAGGQLLWRIFWPLLKIEYLLIKRKNKDDRNK